MLSSGKAVIDKFRALAQQETAVVGDAVLSENDQPISPHESYVADPGADPDIEPN